MAYTGGDGRKTGVSKRRVVLEEFQETSKDADFLQGWDSDGTTEYLEVRETTTSEEQSENGRMGTKEIGGLCEGL